MLIVIIICIVLTVIGFFSPTFAERLSHSTEFMGNLTVVPMILFFAFIESLFSKIKIEK
jgi:hypothetical protein